MSDLLALEPFRDFGGRLKAWPKKQKLQRLAIALIADSFEPGRVYTEREVNDILLELHTFNDWALLRRRLIEWGHLDRSPDGSCYWKTP